MIDPSADAGAFRAAARDQLLKESANDDWGAGLLKNKRGGILSVVGNVVHVLENHPAWFGVLQFNESSLDTEVKAQPPFETPRKAPCLWIDEDDTLAAAWLQREAGIMAGKEIVAQGVQAVARAHGFHPIRDHLNGLAWDGIKRIDDWLTLYLGADPSDYMRAVSAKFLIGGVARVFKPGCKLDTAVILEGRQGAGKSTALGVLGGRWFTDDMPELGTKDSALQMRGAWLMELAELDSMSRADISKVKAFMSRGIDRFRPPFARRPIDVPRECFFAGTSNIGDYGKDPTGARRLWPVRCGVIRIDELRRDRDQLWAEAVVRFRAGDSWWLEEQAVILEATTEQSARFESDVWHDLITAFLEDPKIRKKGDGEPVAGFSSTDTDTCVDDILNHALNKLPSLWTQADKTRIGRTLQAMGWERYQKRASARAREWRYRKLPDESDG